MKRAVTSVRAGRKIRGRRRVVARLSIAAGLALVASQPFAPTADAAAIVQPGQASADSAVFRLGVQSGGTSLRPTAVGHASASYLQTETQASSATVDPGGLGFLLTAIPVCGVTLLPSSRQPQPLTADSADGDSSKTAHGNVAGAGTEVVTVSSSPQFAVATTKPVSQSLLGGLVEITGTATSKVRYVADREQRAESSVTETLSLAGGLVQIDGMHWTAGRRSGGSTVSSAGFSFGKVTLRQHGVPLALPNNVPASTVVEEINALIGPSGLHLTLPTKSTDSATGATSMGPLRVHFAGSSLDRSVITPIAQQVAALESLLSGQAANGSDCSKIKNLIGNVANPAETVSNIALGIAEGAGSLDLDLGGVTASTQAAHDYANPFDSGGFTSGPRPSDGVPAGVTQPGPSAGAGGRPVTSAQAPTLATAPAGMVLQCVTTSPAGRPGCWQGLSVLAGGVTVALAQGLIAADVAYSRRRHRRRRPRRVIV